MNLLRKIFKGADNQQDNMELDKPEEIRKYLKENMKEGYLSEDEGLNIDEFVDEYKRLKNSESKTQEIIRNVYRSKVQ